MQSATTPDAFKSIIKTVTDRIGTRPLDLALETELNAAIPPQSALFEQIFHSCEAAIAAGWMCSREAGGIKYGRVFKPAEELHGYSIDVVDMESLEGPHHAHPNGEIDLVMPLTEGAKFDDRPAGWVVYGPGTAHHPTVTQGRALVLYLLPQGAIEFTR